MLDFDVEIEYIEGRSKKVADFLSRTEIETGEQVINSIYQSLSLNKEVFIKTQRDNLEINKVISALENNEEIKWPATHHYEKL